MRRIDPDDAALAAVTLAGDHSHGVVVGATPGFNRLQGIGYDVARGVLLLADGAENVILTLQ